MGYCPYSVGYPLDISLGLKMRVCRLPEPKDEQAREGISHRPYSL